MFTKMDCCFCAPTCTMEPQKQNESGICKRKANFVSRLTQYMLLEYLLSLMNSIISRTVGHKL